MKGKSTFTEKEARKIRQLIEKKIYANRDEQKIIRDQIRSLGFYIEDFSDKSGYTVEDFNRYVMIVG
jgi:CTP:phosphocholine cytidylyltransferase-like protein